MIFSVYLFINIKVNAQQHNIKVSVSDSLTKQPIENVTIKQLPSGIVGQSDKNGNLYISAKTITISVSLVGYYEKSINIKNDSVVLVGMTRSSMQLKDIVVRNATRLSTYKLLSTIDNKNLFSGKIYQIY